VQEHVTMNETSEHFATITFVFCAAGAKTSGTSYQAAKSLNTLSITFLA